MMCNLTHKDDVTQQILIATERLIAQVGLQNLSMRKVATEAGVALGTLYLYFKTKDDLLNQLAHDLYERFCDYMMRDYDVNESFFDRYQKMWHNKWTFLHDNPTVAINLSQYQAMRGFNEIVERTINDETFLWNHFVKAGQQAGEICQLPAEVLFFLGLGIVLDLAYLQQIQEAEFSASVLQETLLRSWKAISV